MPIASLELITVRSSHSSTVSGRKMGGYFCKRCLQTAQCRARIRVRWKKCGEARWDENNGEFKVLSVHLVHPLVSELCAIWTDLPGRSEKINNPRLHVANRVGHKSTRAGLECESFWARLAEPTLVSAPLHRVDSAIYIYHFYDVNGRYSANRRRLCDRRDNPSLVGTIPRMPPSVPVALSGGRLRAQVIKVHCARYNGHVLPVSLHT
jgi:hypothetical protein